MEMELVKDQVKINNLVGEETVQAVIENDVIVPDVKPDILRIIHIGGDVYPVELQVEQDRVTVKGRVKYKVLYACEDETQPVRSMLSTVDFSQSVFFAGAKSGMKAFTTPSIQYISHDLVNGRKINIKAVIDLPVKVMGEMSLDIVSAVRETEDIQVLTEATKVKSLLGDVEEVFTIREEFRLPEEKPAIEELLRTDVKITGKDVKLTDNKVIVKGDVCVSSVYTASDESCSIQFVRNEAPFTQFIDFPGMSEDKKCEVFYEIKDFSAHVSEDDNGEAKGISMELMLGARVLSEDTRNFDMVVDAYSTSADVLFERKEVVINEPVAESNTGGSVTDIIAIPGDVPGVCDVCTLACNPSVIEYEVYDDKVVVEGIVNTEMIYLTDDKSQPVNCYSQDMPFRETIEIKGAKPEMKCEVVLESGECSFDVLSLAEVEVKVPINARVRLIRESSLQVVTNAELRPVEKEESESRPSITMYYIQPGDSLWAIAKKHRTTVADIMALNSILEPDEISVGQYIVIPPKAG